MNEKSDRGSDGNGPEKPSANRQASEWLVLLESGDATEADRARFKAWMGEDPAHRNAYAALSETWGRLTAMRERVRKAGTAPNPDALLQGFAPPNRTSPRRPILTSAAVLVVAVLVVAVLLLLPGESAIRYHTDVGERRTASLADGSIVELNTDTELLVEYTSEQRRVSMLRGEAFFDVNRRAGRPFLVTAGQGAIRAVGTGFMVRIKSEELVSVMVSEGVVEVEPSARDQSGTALSRRELEPYLLQQGQSAEYGCETTRINQVTPEELERAQAWRRGLLVFEDASLAEVVAEVNRYTQTRIVIADPAISELRLGGTFQAGRLEALLVVLEMGFGIQIDRSRPGTIELHAVTSKIARPPS